jgi:hypothetical protein
VPSLLAQPGLHAADHAVSRHVLSGFRCAHGKPRRSRCRPLPARELRRLRCDESGPVRLRRVTGDRARRRPADLQARLADAARGLSAGKDVDGNAGGRSGSGASAGTVATGTCAVVAGPDWCLAAHLHARGAAVLRVGHVRRHPDQGAGCAGHAQPGLSADVVPVRTLVSAANAAEVPAAARADLAELPPGYAGAGRRGHEAGAVVDPRVGAGNGRC